MSIDILSCSQYSELVSGSRRKVLIELKMNVAVVGSGGGGDASVDRLWYDLNGARVVTMEMRERKENE